MIAFLIIMFSHPISLEEYMLKRFYKCVYTLQ